MNDKASQCDKCGAYMPSSNAEEIRNGFQVCIHCGHENEPNQELVDLILEQEYDIEELKEQVRHLAEYLIITKKMANGSLLTTKETTRSIQLSNRLSAYSQESD